MSDEWTISGWKGLREIEALVLSAHRVSESGIYYFGDGRSARDYHPVRVTVKLPASNVLCLYSLISPPLLQYAGRYRGVDHTNTTHNARMAGALCSHEFGCGQ